MPAERARLAPAGAPLTLPLRILAGLVLGSVHALSFAPWTLWWLQLLSLAAVLLLWLRRDKTEGAMVSLALPLAFGIAWFGVGVSWLFISMHRYGGMPAPMAGAAVVLMALVLTSFFVVVFRVAALLRLDRRDNPSNPQGAFGAATQRMGQALAFGALWLLAEWTRGWLFTGFPWLATGYAHVDSPLIGFAPLVGVYGVCGLAAGSAFLIAAGAAAWLDRDATAQRPWRVVLPYAAALFALFGTGLLAAQINWSEPVGRLLKVRLLQGNVPQQLKFAPGASARAMQQYADMSSQPSSLGPLDLIVMPETAWTVPWQATPPAIVERLLRPGADGATPAIAIGMPLAVDLSSGTIANSVLLIRGGQPDDVSARYDKQHLVPFGEFVPFGFQWFVDMMQIPLGSFARGGATQPPLSVADQRVAFNICYEDLFGEELAHAVRSNGGQATLMVNVSNIAWFGDSHVLQQHLQIARMRAIELARPMLRATNTGVTASIDARGAVRAAAPSFTLAVLEDEVIGMRGDTPFARWTHMPVLLFSVLVVTVLIARRTRQDRRTG